MIFFFLFAIFFFYIFFFSLNTFYKLFINRNFESDGEYEEQFENFEFSDEAADFSTRRAKSQDLFENRSCQSTVWNSIANLERKTAFSSRTSALHDNFLNHRPKLNEYLRNFRLEYGQSGAIFIINGQIKGFELFANPSIYQDYHEKIFRSYIMEAITDYQSKYTYVIDDVREFLRELSHSEFRRSDSKGMVSMEIDGWIYRYEKRLRGLKV